MVNIDRSRLEGAPSYSSSDPDRWSDPTYGRKVNDYYGVTGPYCLWRPAQVGGAGPHSDCARRLAGVKVFWIPMRGKRVGNPFQLSARVAAGVPCRPAWILVSSAPNKKIWAE